MKLISPSPVIPALPLDIEERSQLLPYLRASGRIGPGEEPSLRLLTGGVSNRTVLLERTTGERWVLKQALEKLRVAVEWYSDPKRIEREALGIRTLSALAPGSIPTLVFEDPTHHLLAMSAVPEPHDNWKSLLLARRLVPEHVTQFGGLLGTIHRQSFARRAELESLFAERAFFESLRLEPYYLYSASHCPAAADFLHALVAETRGTQLALVHGDYSPKNILVHHGRLILLDHEVIHWGDPAFDLGFALAHLLSKAHHLIDHRVAFGEAAARFWEAWSHAAGDLPWRRDVEPRAVRHTLGCLLARVTGRSPLEYLDGLQRARQLAVCLELMATPSSRIPELIEQFLRRLHDQESHGPA